jgi:peroxiredoxin
MRFQTFAWPLLFAFFLAGAAAAQQNEIVEFGDPFPEIRLPAPTDPAARDYLGISDGVTFTPSLIRADVLLVEILNVHCPHCQMQMPSFNELYNLIEQNAGTRGRIKMLGIAAGNLPDEVQDFTRRYQVPFPMFADPRFQAHRAIGGSATPFSIYVRQDSPGKPGVVAGTHLGLNTRYESTYTELQRLTGVSVAELRRQGQAAARVRQAITPLFSEQELEYRVRTAFTTSGGRIVDFARLDLRSGRRVYTALMRRGDHEVRLFAEATSRPSVCDICHDVHFIYLFDTDARVIGFEPLQLTKYGNVNWNAGDVEKMRRRMVGRYLTVPHSYDPRVDAVTSATITSAIIFDSLEQGEALLEELREQGLLKK